MGLISWWKNRKKKSVEEELIAKGSPTSVDKTRVASCHCVCDLDDVGVVDAAIDLVMTVGSMVTTDVIEDVISDVVSSVCDD